MINYPHRFTFRAGKFTGTPDHNPGRYANEILDIFLRLVPDPFHRFLTLRDQGRTAFDINHQGVKIAFAGDLELIEG